MTSKQLRSLAKTMRELGITHLKTADIELSFTSPAAEASLPKQKASIPVEQPLSPEEDAEIRHKIEEVRSVMQLGDEDLVERLFPVREVNGIEDFPEVE